MFEKWRSPKATDDGAVFDCVLKGRVANFSAAKGRPATEQPRLRAFFSKWLVTVPTFEPLVDIDGFGRGDDGMEGGPMDPAPFERRRV